MSQQKSILNIMRKLCLFGLPVLLLSASLFHFEILSPFQTSSKLTSWLYTIALTANIGYFTNYIAIKMLFKPYYKTAFGRQGLIPKNQDKLADSLSKTLTDNFLSSNQWSEYLKNSNLVNHILSKIKISSSEWLAEPENIEKITQWLIQYCRENEESINRSLNSIQHDLVSDFSSQLDAKKLLAKGFEWLENQFEENPENMHQVIDPIIKTLAENIPEISKSLTQALDNHIEEQDTIKRSIAKMAKWSADFSEEDIKQHLFRMVASFEFRETLFNGLKSLLNEYKDKPLLYDGNELKFSKLIADFISGHLDSINWVDLAVNQLKQFKIDDILSAFHKEGFIMIDNKLAEEDVNDWLIEQMVFMINQLDLRQLVKNKAAHFSPKKMENIFQSMISEQLIFIELLGAILGALSGLALLDFEIFFILSTLAAGFYVLDNVVTTYYRQKEK